MKIRVLWLALAVAACRSSGVVRPPDDSAAPAIVARDIGYLSSDQLEGRATGTPGNDSAAAYIARRFGELGLTSVTKQPFVVRSAALAHAGFPAEVPSNNVYAILPGSDPALRGQYLILGAHFDHIGRTGVGALDPEARTEIHNGADDNASGVAAILDLARRFTRKPPKRSVLFVAFSGEELGLLGSRHFVEQLPVSRDSVQAMLNFDMVGRLRDDQLLVYGVETATQLRGIVDSANVGVGLQVTGRGDGWGASDHSSFYAVFLPVLHFFTNIHPDYHRATDDADKVNVPGLLEVASLAERVARNLTDRPDRLTFVRVAAPAPTTSSRQGSSVYLGSIPDMGADVKGLRLAGVRAGSPADQGGLKDGDVVIELGGTPVTDLQTYTDALYSHKPGDAVDIVVMRGGERLTLRVTLGRRN